MGLHFQADIWHGIQIRAVLFKIIKKLQFSL